MKFIYKMYFPTIRNLVTTNSGNEEEAKDIFQEALLIIYDKITNNDFNLTCSFKTFLYSVCRNLWHEQLRYKKKNLRTIEDYDAYVDVGSEIDKFAYENIADYLFYKHFLSLTASCQEIIKMLLNKVSSKEIVKSMGFSSEDYANKRKYQCKQILFKRIKNDPLYKKVIENGNNF